MTTTRTFRALLLPVLLSLCCSGQRQQAGRVRIGRSEWRVEIAADPATRQRGLSGRERIPEGTGMLFVFPREEVLAFHMLNCRVPLDVAFISARRRIVEIRTMLVEADPRNPTCLYSSRFPARYALEAAAGSFHRAGVKVGETVELLGSARTAAKGAR